MEAHIDKHMYESMMHARREVDFMVHKTSTEIEIEKRVHNGSRTDMIRLLLLMYIYF